MPVERGASVLDKGSVMSCLLDFLITRGASARSAVVIHQAAYVARLDGLENVCAFLRLIGFGDIQQVAEYHLDHS